MTCPHGHAPLQITERHGVEIDYCPECRGVWLDRGELDKILDRAESAQPRNRTDADQPRHRATDPGHHPHGQKRKSWLSEMLDF